MRSLRLSTHFSADHPRIRGENLWGGGIYRKAEGSPPHTRGKCLHLVRPAADGGITPAYAGKIRAQHGHDAGKADHPRIRGENPRDTISEQESKRITPAYAGKILDLVQDATVP